MSSAFIQIDAETISGLIQYLTEENRRKDRIIQKLLKANTEEEAKTILRKEQDGGSYLNEQQQ